MGIIRPRATLRVRGYFRRVNSRVFVDNNISSSWEKLCKWDECQVRPVGRIPSVPLSSPALLLSPGDFFFVFPFSQLKPAFGYCPCRKDLTCTQESNLFHYLGSCGLIRRFENLSSTRMCNSNEGRLNLLPFSRRWYSGPCPYAVASRSRWAVWAKERRSSDVIE